MTEQDKQSSISLIYARPFIADMINNEVDIETASMLWQIHPGKAPVSLIEKMILRVQASLDNKLHKKIRNQYTFNGAFEVEQLPNGKYKLHARDKDGTRME